MSAGINIANYEVFLLRFIDGDLSAAELAGLEEFLEQHPQIRQELQLLQSTVLVPDPQVTFEHKELLYRGQPEIHADNQTGFLLSYIDQELSATDKDAVEKYIAATPAAQAELALLQMTRLEPDRSQVFQHKASLYRHRRRVLPVYWWSAGAAAVVAGLLVFVWPPANLHPGAKAPVAILNTTPHPASTANTVAAQNTAAATAQALPATHATSSNPVVDVATTGARSTAANTTARPVSRATVVAQAVPTPSTSAATVTDHAPATPAHSNDIITASTGAPAAAPANSSTLSRNPSVNNVTTGTETSSGSTPAVVAASSQDAAPERPPVMMAVASQKEQASAPASIHGELIASVVSSGDSKLLDKVTNVARFFAKKKANNK